MRKADFIFRIGQLVRAIEARSGLDTLDPVARQLLLLIAETQAQGQAPTVTRVVAKANLGTAPTIYARLAVLERDGWIIPTPDPSDGRAKRLRLAPRAEKAFTQMSRELSRLSEETSPASGGAV